MYLTIMKPQALQQIAVLARGLWIVEGPEGVGADGKLTHPAD